MLAARPVLTVTVSRPVLKGGQNPRCRLRGDSTCQSCQGLHAVLQEATVKAPQPVSRMCSCPAPTLPLLFPWAPCVGPAAA